MERFPVASDSGEISYERTFDLSEVNTDFTRDEFIAVQHGIDWTSPTASTAGRPCRARSTRTCPGGDGPGAVRSQQPDGMKGLTTGKTLVEAVVPLLLRGGTGRDLWVIPSGWAHQTRM